jgi:hypothetical protein
MVCIMGITYVFSSSAADSGFLINSRSSPHDSNLQKWMHHTLNNFFFTIFLQLGDPKKKFSPTHTKDFCENNSSNSPDFEEILSEICTHLENRFPKYSNIFNIFLLSSLT